MSRDEVTEAEDMIRAAIAAGPWPVQALKAILREAGVRDFHVRRAVHNLTARQELFLIAPRFWISREFASYIGKCDSSLFVSGASRVELIQRLSERAPSPQSHVTTTTDELMQGEGAERLAAYAYDREVNAWGAERWED